MKRNSSPLMSLALLLALAGVFSQSVLAQDTITVQSQPFYRFIVSNQTLGHLLTSNFSEGTGNPYNYAYFPFPFQADIVVQPSGYNPRAGQGLLRLYRWQVSQSARVYYYYSTYYSNLGGDYHYQGSPGFVLPADGSYGGTPVHFWYSQSYGYYFTLDGEYPPCCSFSYHGVPFRLPQGQTYIFDAQCAGMQAQRDECELNGGIWNNTNCTCRYEDPDPCLTKPSLCL